MSRTWDLEIGADVRDPSARIRLSEVHADLKVEIEYPDIATLAAYVDDEEARRVRDWLSWHLGDGPEPGDVP